MYKIFNINNERILFTMDYLGCQMQSDFVGRMTVNEDLPCFEGIFEQNEETHEDFAKMHAKEQIS